MSSFVIVGAGGFGLEILDYVRADLAAGRMSGHVRGFVDDRRVFAQLPRDSCPLLGPVDEYAMESTDAVIVAIGAPDVRKRVVMRLKSRAARIVTYVHPTSYVAPSATLASGVFVGPYACINAAAVVSEHVVVNVFGILGHGAMVGAYSILSPYAALNGDASIGEGCFLGTRATIFPRVSLGSNCSVDSHSYAKRSCGDDMLISNRGHYRELKKRG